MRRLRLSLARLARLWLAAALLAAWHGALVHPIEHVDELGELVHPGGGRAHDHESDAPLCDALAALTACAPPPAAPPVVAGQPTPSLPAFFAGAPRAAEAPPFLSQGPPSRL